MDEIKMAIRFLQSKDGAVYRCGSPVIGDSLDREHVRMILEDRKVNLAAS